MAVPKMLAVLGASIVMALLCAIALPTSAHAQSLSSSPAPAPTSDGISIDQGIAYLLMLVALVLTYLIHPLDASSIFGR